MQCPYCKRRFSTADDHEARKQEVLTHNFTTKTKALEYFEPLWTERAWKFAKRVFRIT